MLPVQNQIVGVTLKCDDGALSVFVQVVTEQIARTEWVLFRNVSSNESVKAMELWETIRQYISDPLVRLMAVRFEPKAPLGLEVLRVQRVEL